jgi:hypothetical protein
MQKLAVSNSFLFFCLLLLFSCSKKASNPEYADTVAVEMVVQEDTNGASVISQTAVTLPLTRHDSLYEYNTVSGILNTRQVYDSAVKLYVYLWDKPHEPKITEGEKFIALFKDHREGDLVKYRVEELAFKYTEEGYPDLPYLQDETKTKSILLKGLHIKNPAGIEFPDSFFEPGDSIGFRLHDRQYTFHVEGQIAADTLAVSNYRLLLSMDERNRTQTVELLGRTLMPYPNYSDIIPEYIHWAGDLNDDGYVDLLAGEGFKSCGTLTLWIGQPGLEFKKTAVLGGCGC